MGWRSSLLRTPSSFRTTLEAKKMGRPDNFAPRGVRPSIHNTYDSFLFINLDSLHFLSDCPSGVGAQRVFLTPPPPRYHHVITTSHRTRRLPAPSVLVKLSSQTYQKGPTAWLELLDSLRHGRCRLIAITQLECVVYEITQSRGIPPRWALPGPKNSPRPLMPFLSSDIPR